MLHRKHRVMTNPGIMDMLGNLGCFRGKSEINILFLENGVNQISALSKIGALVALICT